MVYTTLKSAQKSVSGKIAKLVVLLLLLVQVATGQSVNVGKAGSQGKVLKKYIEPAELKKIVENPVDSIWIIDVRSEKAYSNGHIPTAKSFPAGTVSDRLNEIPKNKYLIIYCTVGANAQIASKKLRKAGYKRYINWGGISRWEWEKEVSQPINQ
jgi:rhodanese-related sulfurtransferase